MAQIRDGCYRVVAKSEEDMDLLDLHEGGLVAVENQHDDYSGEIESDLSRIEPGNCINAVIQSEDVYRPDGIWHFLELDVYEETEYHALNMDHITPDIHLIDGVFKKGQSPPELIKEGETPVGFKIARQDTKTIGTGPVRANFKETYTTLSKFDNPPYEILSLFEEEIPFEIRYYMSKKGTNTAKNLIEAGNYVFGHKR